MNLAKGFKRVTLILSFLVGPLVLFILLTELLEPYIDEGWNVSLYVKVVGLGSFYFVYCVVWLIVKGFRSINPKGEKDNKSIGTPGGIRKNGGMN